MQDNVCLLCKKIIGSPKYNIDENYTKYSNLLLRGVLEGVLNTQIIVKSNLLMCTSCFELLNELDLAEINCKAVRKKILNCYKCVEQNISRSVHVQTDKIIQSAGADNDLDTIEIKQDDDIELSFDIHGKIEKVDVNNETINELEELSSLHIKCEIDEMTKSEIETCEKNMKELNTSKHSRKKNKVNSNDIIKPFKCTECPKTWKTFSKLKNHILSHSNERPFICEVCGQAYKHKAALDVHIGMHNGVNPFVCMYCNKSFTQKGALQRHLPIHTGETPFQCDLCGKRFVHHTSFSIHQLSHSGQKHYKCSVCGLALFSGSHLKRHMRVHTGERQFACSICGRRFAERYNLIAHQKLHVHTDSTVGS